MRNKELKIGGTYEHYKGKPYKVINVVRHSETLEELVLYKTLYNNDLGELWVRPKEMFLESFEKEGQLIERFKLVE